MVKNRIKTIINLAIIGSLIIAIFMSLAPLLTFKGYSEQGLLVFGLDGIGLLGKECFALHVDFYDSFVYKFAGTALAFPGSKHFLFAFIFIIFGLVFSTLNLLLKKYKYFEKISSISSCIFSLISVILASVIPSVYQFKNFQFQIGYGLQIFIAFSSVAAILSLIAIILAFSKHKKLKD